MRLTQDTELIGSVAGIQPRQSDSKRFTRRLSSSYPWAGALAGAEAAMNGLLAALCLPLQSFPEQRDLRQEFMAIPPPQL